MIVRFIELGGDGALSASKSLALAAGGLREVKQPTLKEDLGGDDLPDHAK